MNIKSLISRLFGVYEDVYYSKNHKKSAVIINDVDFGHILSGKQALVTGGTSGIGRAIAQKMIECGTRVTIIGKNAEKANRIAQEIHCDFIALDLTDTKQMISRILDYIKDKGINILVNSAGIFDTEMWLEKTPENFDLVMNTNLKAAYFMYQTVARHMIEHKIQGNILNVSSLSMRPSWGPYQLSKRSLNGMTLGFAQRLAPYGITVNGLTPGVTITPMAAKFIII